MVSAGVRDQRVEVLAPIYTGRSDMGAQEKTWTSRGSRWARVNYLKGTRTLQQGDVWLASSITVLMLYTDEVTEHCRLSWRGKTYAIASINGSRREGTLTISADLVNEGQQGIEPEAGE